MAELYAFILGIQMEEVGLSVDIFTASLMHHFNVTEDESISKPEFVSGVGKWLSSTSGRHITQLWSRKSKVNSDEQQRSLLMSRSQDKGHGECRKELRVWWNYVLITIREAITAMLSQPLMENLDELGTSVGIPSFFVLYVLLPLAMSYRQTLSEIASAKKKTIKEISLTFIEIYNGLFMNNVVGLTIFLAIVYVRNISWYASAEVLVICTLMGVVAGVSTRFPVWTSTLAIVLYPLSHLLLLYVLTTVFDWSQGFSR